MQNRKVAMAEDPIFVIMMIMSRLNDVETFVPNSKIAPPLTPPLLT